MNHADLDSNSSLQIFDLDPTVVYPIEVVERLTQMPRRAILICCRHSLVSPVADPEISGYFFNREAIRVLRCIEYLQVRRGVNFAGIKFILNLSNEVQLLEAAMVHASSTQALQSREKKQHANR